jgi:hypothetical protein
MGRFEDMGFTPDPDHRGSRWLDDAGESYSRRYMDEIYDATEGNRFLVNMTTEMAEAAGMDYREFIRSDDWQDIHDRLFSDNGMTFHDMIAELYDNGWMQGDDRDELYESTT